VVPTGLLDAETQIFRKVVIMFFLPRRYLNFLLIMMMVGGLAACASTDSGSEAVIEDSSIESTTPAEAEVVEEAPPATEEPMQFEVTTPYTSGLEQQEMEVMPDDATTSPGQQADAIEEYPIESYDVETTDDGASTASAQQPEVQAVEEFPIQRYEIDEPGEVQGVDETDAEIERLRQELAATESELERIRTEEEQQDYATSETLASADSSADDMASTQQEEMMTARVREQPSPATDTSDLPGMPTENSVYFGYDQAALDQQYESVLFAHAEFLKANPGMRVEIEGNCDERGSREYNIALGQRRALTVKRALELLGVEGYRITTVSFGSEKPVAFGHDESSWRQNRRADIVY
jgi:peptidoglycan-associated lipoprotein